MDKTNETMKQLIQPLLLYLVILLSISSCIKDDESSGTLTEPDRSFTIQFYVIDSLGNLVFPADGPFLSDFTPDDFSAKSEFSESTGGSYNSHPQYGHVFRFGESGTIISQNATLWLNDSIIRFYPCFGDMCDTLIVFNPFNGVTMSSAEMIIWKNDTILNYDLSVLTYELNE